jgi:hypothetical protein
MTCIMHFFILSEFQLATRVHILLCKARRSRGEVKLGVAKGMRCREGHRRPAMPHCMLDGSINSDCRVDVHAVSQPIPAVLPLVCVIVAHSGHAVLVMAIA